MAGLGQVLGWLAYQAPRDAEVGQQGHAVLGEQDVGRLHIPVDDTFAVGIGQGLGRLLRDPERLRDGQRAHPPDPVAQRLALDVGHGVPQPFRRLAGVIHRADVRMLQPGGGRDLPAKPLGVDLEGGRGSEELERYRTIVLEIAGVIDGRHPPFPKLPQEEIGPDAGGQGQGTGHGLVVDGVKPAGCSTETPAGASKRHGQRRLTLFSPRPE